MARGDPSFSLLWDSSWNCALNLLNGDRNSEERMEDGGCVQWLVLIIRELHEEPQDSQ